MLVVNPSLFEEHMDQSLPFELRQYIEREHASIIDGNQADHRPTSQHYLDQATAGIVQMYNRGVELMKTIEAELPVCLRYYNEVKRWYQPTQLRTFELLGEWVVAPQYVSALDEMRRVRKVFE